MFKSSPMHVPVTKALRILAVVWRIIRGICMVYAIVFSFAATALVFLLAYQVMKPFNAVKAYRSLNPRETLYMRTYREQLRAKKEPDSLSQRFMPLDSISPALVKAVIAAEDDGFYVHPGFDLVAILNAYQYNREKNSLRHGASTLTQQMAKNLFVGGEREFSRKYAELFYAVLMEALLGKERILELYMNYAQWGPALFGCEAAAQHYFKKSCTVLSVDQAARLAAVLAKPMTLNPHFTQSPLLDKRIRVIGDNLYRRHLIDDSLYIHLTATDSMIRVMELKEGDTSNRSSSGGDSNGKKEKSRLHF